MSAPAVRRAEAADRRILLMLGHLAPGHTAGNPGNTVRRTVSVLRAFGERTDAANDRAVLR